MVVLVVLSFRSFHPRRCPHTGRIRRWIVCAGHRCSEETAEGTHTGCTVPFCGKETGLISFLSLKHRHCLQFVFSALLVMSAFPAETFLPHDYHIQIDNAEDCFPLRQRSRLLSPVSSGSRQPITLRLQVRCEVTVTVRVISLQHVQYNSTD